jgi:outer membrane protein
MLKHCIVSSIVILLTITVQTRVGASEERQVTLSQAITIALEENHEMRATKSSLLAQKADVGIARGSLLPQLGFEQRVSRTNNPTGVFMSKLNQERFTQADFNIDSLNHPSPVTDLQSMVIVDQTIFMGKALVGLDIARTEYAAKDEDYGRKREETALKVTQTYLAVRTAKEYVNVARAGINDAKEHLRIAEARYKNGLGLYSDVLRAKTAVIEAEQRIVTAQKHLSVARKGLAMLLGATEPLDIAPDEKLDFPLREMDYYQNGAAFRKDVKALQIRYDNAKNGVRLAESKYLPTLGVRASYQLNDQNRLFGTEGESWWLMGIVRWDLFDGASREYERSKARHKQAETEEQLKGLAQIVSFNITEAYLAAEEARKNTELSRAALASAEEGRKLVASRFENSLSPVVDLLDVQLNVDHTRANVVARENDYRVAVIRLAYESGTILSDLDVK